MVTKAKLLAATYGKSVAEMVDLYKDIQYVSTVQHKSKTISLLLWIFALFAIV